MEITKKNRTELKEYFKINDKPTQEEFADFIEAGLNQAEDKIAKVQGNPISIEAEGERVGTQEVLDLYENFADDNPQWSINLNPRANAEEPTSNQPGLNIKDATGQSRLFIKSGEGNVGLGTLEPGSKLTVEGKNLPSLLSVIDTTNERATILEVTQEKGNGMLSLRNSGNETITQISGAVAKPSFFLGNLGVGTKDPNTHVEVSGENPELRITNTGSGNTTAARLSLKNSVTTEQWEIGLQQGQDSLQFFSTKNPSKKITMKKEGRLELPGGVVFGGSDTEHVNQNGALYQHQGQAFLATKDNFFIKNVGADDTASKFHFDTDKGQIAIGGSNPKAPLSIKESGKETGPDASLHITNSCILFGGANKDNHNDSAQISAGKHEANSLNIVGMGREGSDRKIDFWAEGGMNIRGQIRIPEHLVVAFSVSLSTNMTGSKKPLKFGQVNYNIGGHFKNNQEFLAPVKGMYLFTMCMRHNTNDGDVGWKLRLNTGFVNGLQGDQNHERSMLVARTLLHMNSRTVITPLQAGDKVWIEQFGSGGNDNYSSGFEGILLQALM